MPLKPQAKFELVADDKTAATLRSAQNRFERFSRETSSILKGAFAVFAGGALVQGITNVLGKLEEIERQSEALGTSAEAFQRLVFTFGEFDLQADDVADALGTLADRAEDAKSGTQSFIEDFALLGVRVDDLRGKRPAELFRLIAERVAEIEDPTRRTAGILRIFGDDLGRRLAPLLVQGSDQLKEYADRWDELGRIIDEEAVAAGAEAAETFRDLRQEIGAEFTQVIAENAEAIGDLARALTALVDAAAKIPDFAKDTGIFLAQLATGVKDPSDQLAVLADEIDDVEDRLRSLRGAAPVAGPGGGGAFAFFTPNEEEIQRLEALLARLREAKRLIESGRDPGLIDPEASTDAGKDAGRAFVEAFRFELNLGLDKPLTADRLIPKLELTPHDIFPLSEIVDPAFEELEKKSKDSKDQIDEDFQSLAESIGFSLHRSFSDMFLGIETGFDDLLRRMAADFLASGLLDLIRQIGGNIPGPIGDFLELLPGFQHGGSFQVGGSGGPDSQLVAFRATPGERVNVNPQPATAGGAPTIVQNFHFGMVFPNELEAHIRNVAGPTAQAVALKTLESQRGRI